MHESAKLANVQGLYLQGIRDGDPAAVHRFSGERYTQHNTHVKDGKEGFIEFFEDFKKRNPLRDIQIVRSMIHDVLMAGGDPHNISRYISAEYYIQHNKEVPVGIEAFRTVTLDPNRALWSNGMPLKESLPCLHG